MKTSTFFLSVFSFVPLVLLPLVEAHGIVDTVNIDGKSYQGPIAGGKSTPGSPIRQISTASPVKGAMNKAMTCGPDAKPASFVAPANPGSSISVLWTANDRKNWPHNTGPMEVYLASCGSVSCDKFDASKAQWFKINEAGKRSGGWVQQDQFNRKAHSFKLPSTLARGGYLLRHEIIGLHLANQPGGAEFYPSCIQINVGGSQTGAPSSNELVRFPGAYKDNDAGILVNAFGNAAYKFPGPAVSKLASKTSNVATSTSDESTTDESTTDESTTDETTTDESTTDETTDESTTDEVTGDESTTDEVTSDESTDDAGSPSSSPVPSSSTGKTKTKSPAQPSPSVVPSKSRDCQPTKKRAVYDDSDDSIPSTPETPLEDSKPRHFSRVMGRIVKFRSH